MPDAGSHRAGKPPLASPPKVVMQKTHSAGWLSPEDDEPSARLTAATTLEPSLCRQLEREAGKPPLASPPKVVMQKTHSAGWLSPEDDEPSLCRQLEREGWSAADEPAATRGEVLPQLFRTGGLGCRGVRGAVG